MKISKQKLTIAAANKGWNFKTLAERAGLSRTTISLILSGKMCRIDTTLKIANALGFRVSEIADNSVFP
jgi:DNA-binding Xre family transcriptional regulator